MLVSGEPGIGKSRLAQTLVERLAGEPHTRLRLFCSPHHQDIALYPTITQLERAAGFRREDTADAAARQARSGAGPGDQRSRRGRAAARGSAVDPYRRALPAAQPHPAEAKGEDAAGAGGAGRRAGGAAAGADPVRGRPLERPDLARALRPDHRSGAGSSGPADRHLSPRVHPAVDRPAARQPARSQPPGAAAAGRDDRRRHRRQGPARGDRRADRRPHRRGTALCRGIDQGGGRERHADRHRRPLHGSGTDAAAGDPGEPAGLAAGPARPAGAGARGGADRRGARPAVLARADRRRGADAVARNSTTPWRSWSAPS